MPRKRPSVSPQRKREPTPRAETAASPPEGVSVLPGTLHEFLSVGSGRTRRTEARIKRDIPLDQEYPDDLKNVDAVSGGDKPDVTWYASYFEWQTADLKRWVSSIEKWAKGILKEIQATKDVRPTPDGGKRLVIDDALSLGVLREIEKLGFRRGQHVQWHAAAILKHLRVLRANLAPEEIASPAEVQAAAVAGIQVGALLREAEIRFRIDALQAQKGGAHPKGIPAVASFIRSQLRKDPTLTASVLWRSFRLEECDGLKIGKAKLFVEKDLLRVIEKQNGKWRHAAELSFPSFRRYVTAARKTLAH